MVFLKILVTAMNLFLLIATLNLNIKNDEKESYGMANTFVVVMVVLDMIFTWAI